MIDNILNIAKSYIGTQQGDNKHKEIIDKYNAVKPYPVGYKMKYTDDWCAAFVTVIGDLAKASHLIGRECGVQRYIHIFKRNGAWLGGAKPMAGDLIVFDWRNDGWSDHIGIVENLEGNIVTVIEGNTSRRVARNSYVYNDWRISGYARPKYPQPGRANPKSNPVNTKGQLLKSNEELAKEVMVGIWKNGEERKTLLTTAGYDYHAIQKIVDNDVRASSKKIKTNEELAEEVIKGVWKNGEERKMLLTSAGYNYNAIQRIVDNDPRVKRKN